MNGAPRYWRRVIGKLAFLVWKYKKNCSGVSTTVDTSANTPLNYGFSACRGSNFRQIEKDRMSQSDFCHHRFFVFNGGRFFPPII
jgi:hypothetical protein